MPDKPTNAYPFLTRDMLAWGSGASFELQMSLWANNTDDLLIQGATREGPFTFRYTPQALGSEETVSFGLADVPIFVTVQGTALTTVRGDYYVVVYLAQSKTRILKLISGYPSYGTAVSWPSAPFETELIGRNKGITAISNNPAAGAEISKTIFAAHVMLLKAIQVTLVTDGTAATRQLHLQLPLHGSATKLDIAAAATQTASLTRTYIFAPGLSATPTAASTFIYTPIPADMQLFGANTIDTVTDNLAAGDNYGSMTFYYEPLFNINQ